MTGVSYVCLMNNINRFDLIWDSGKDCIWWRTCSPSKKQGLKRWKKRSLECLAENEYLLCSLNSFTWHILDVYLKHPSGETTVVLDNLSLQYPAETGSRIFLRKEDSLHCLLFLSVERFSFQPQYVTLDTTEVTQGGSALEKKILYSVLSPFFSLSWLTDYKSLSVI